MKNTVQKYLFYLKQQNVRPKKYALQHTINHQGEIFNVVNKLHIKYKKNAEAESLLHFTFT